MKVSRSTLLSGVLLLLTSHTTPALAQSDTCQCPLQTSSADAAALEYAYAIQDLLYNFYAAQDLNASSINLPSSSTGVPATAEEISQNFQGLRTQANLALQAISQLGGSATGYMLPTACTYTYPAGLSSDNTAQAFITNSFRLEASLCGAFIGLADYVTSPQVASLVARIAAEHAIHADYVRSLFAPQPYFMSNSTMLTPAFTPEMILSDSPTSEPFTVGHLGQFLGDGCPAAPDAPCGAQVSFGPLVPVVSYTSMPAGEMSSSAGMSDMTSSTMMGGGGLPTTTATSTMGSGAEQSDTETAGSTMPTYTGAASAMRGPSKRWAVAAVAGAGGVAAGAWM